MTKQLGGLGGVVGKWSTETQFSPLFSPRGGVLHDLKIFVLGMGVVVQGME